MPEPKIVEHDSSEEIDGGYAYYDRSKHEIHILKPGPLYQRVLEHEMNHASHGMILRNLIILSERVTGLSVMVSTGLFVAMFLLGGILLAPISSLPIISAILIGGVFGIMFLFSGSFAFDALEEFFAEHAARARARQPRRNRGQDTGASSPMPEDYLGP